MVESGKGFGETVGLLGVGSEEWGSLGLVGWCTNRLGTLGCIGV